MMHVNPSAPADEAAATHGTMQAASPLRGLLLLAGAVGFSVLATWMWMLGRVDGQFVLLDKETVAATLPLVLVLAVVGCAALGMAGVIWALMRDGQLRGAIGWCLAWCKSHPLLAAMVLIVAALGAMDLYEVLVDAEARRFNRGKGMELRKYMVREDVKSWLLFVATVMLALSIAAFKPWCSTCHRQLGDLRKSFRTAAGARGWLVAAFAVPVVLGSVMSRFALEGLPHFSDSLTYQMQGRMLYAGELSMEKPVHPDLFIHSLFFVTDGQHKHPATGEMLYEGTRFFGKYPIGWPAILGFFDTLGVGFMANAVMAGLGALLTFGLARQVASRRVAVVAALLFGLCPWVWFNGANFASHGASMVAVNGFLFFFLRVVAAKPRASFGAAAGAGLCLGAALLVRPFDATMFALPAILLSFALLLREPKRWITHGAVISLATFIGIGIYLWSNAMTTGQATLSPYTLEGRWAADWDTGIKSIVHRFQFQWAEMNARFPGYGIGGMTLAVIGAIIAWQRGRFHRSPALAVLVAGNLLFFLGTTPFLFTNVWWGPRWLLPVTPLLAILVAQVVEVVMRGANESRVTSGPAPIAGFHHVSRLLLLLLVACTLIGIVEYGGKAYVHRIAPPHNVSAAAHERALSMKLNQVVIGMPLDGGGIAPLDPRAGMVFMTAPLASNPIIYVRKVDNWPAKSRETFPDRQLYELIADKEAPGGFVIRKLE